MKNRETLLAERDHADIMAILRAYRSFVSAPKVSKQTGIAPDRVLFLIHKIHRIANLHTHTRITHCGLSVRVLNTLGNHNIVTRSEARSALESGEWKNWRNFGAKSADELRQFLEDGFSGKI